MYLVTVKTKPKRLYNIEGATYPYHHWQTLPHCLIVNFISLLNLFNFGKKYLCTIFFYAFFMHSMNWLSSKHCLSQCKISDFKNENTARHDKYQTRHIFIEGICYFYLHKKIVKIQKVHNCSFPITIYFENLYSLSLKFYIVIRTKDVLLTYQKLISSKIFTKILHTMVCIGICLSCLIFDPQGVLFS